jgi:cation diffusion facilitator family transporter
LLQSLGRNGDATTYRAVRATPSREPGPRRAPLLVSDEPRRLTRAAPLPLAAPAAATVARSRQGVNASHIVWAALIGNALVAVVKLGAAVLSGSSALYAEFAHSVADTTNQGLLLLSLSLAQRRPDEEHPLGYGGERFFWGFVAAVSIFTIGATFSVYEGVSRIISGTDDLKHVGIGFAALGFATVFEGAALSIALRHFRAGARAEGRSLWEYVQRSRDPTSKTALFEDTGALIGIAVAAAGLGLSAATGQAFWDGAASIVIGVLLAVIAFTLARESRKLLLGRAPEPDETAAIRRAIEGSPGVERVLDLDAVHLAPDEILVAADVEFNDDLDAEEIEDAIDEVERRITAAEPDATRIFIEPEDGSGDEAGGPFPPPSGGA